MSAHRYSWFGAGGSPKVGDDEKQVAHGTSNASTAVPAEDCAKEAATSRLKQIFPSKTHDGAQAAIHAAQAKAAAKSKHEPSHGNAMGLLKPALSNGQPTNFMKEGSANYPHTDAASSLAAAIGKKNSQAAAGGTVGTGGKW